MEKAGNKSYEYCFFDLDGTLTDSSSGITNAVRYALDKYGIREPDRRKLYRFIGRRLRSPSGSFMGFPRSGVWRLSGITGNITGTGAFTKTVFMTGWKRC